MELKLKLYLVGDDGEKFMGIGVLWLLEKTDALGSLRKAAIDMTISYTKAYGMVRRLEEQLGVPVLERKKGGSSRDGARLTDFGKELVRLYSAFQDEVKAGAREPWERFSRALGGAVAREEEKRDE